MIIRTMFRGRRNSETSIGKIVLRQSRILNIFRCDFFPQQAFDKSRNTFEFNCGGGAVGQSVTNASGKLGVRITAATGLSR